MHAIQHQQGKMQMKDMRAVAPLVDSMTRSWKRGMPPVSQIASAMVYGHTFMSLRELAPVFPQNLRGKRLVDLGAGDPIAMIDFAQACGVSEYVAVDKYTCYPTCLAEGCGIRLVNDDMLGHLAGMDDESANIVMLAIDSIVLSNADDLRAETRYVELLLANIARVVPVSGIALGVNSEIIERLADFGFVKVDGICNIEGTGVFWRLQ